MGASIEERREVASEMRQRVYEGYYFVVTIVALELGIDFDDYGDDYDSFSEDAWNRLADLIEPEPERTCRAEQDYEAMEDGIPDCRIWRCECGEKFPSWRGGKPIYCPACGAKVVDE